MQLWASIRTDELSVDVFLPASESKPLEGLVRTLQHGRIRNSRSLALSRMPHRTPAGLDLEAIEDAIAEARPRFDRRAEYANCDQCLTPRQRTLPEHALAGARLLIWRFSAVADTWQLSGRERSLIVGLAPETCVEKLLPWAIDHALLTRMRSIVEFWLCLHHCADDSGLSRRWLRTRLDDPPFCGRRPLDLLVAGQVAQVRRYLESMSTHLAQAQIRQSCDRSAAEANGEGVASSVVE